MARRFHRLAASVGGAVITGLLLSVAAQPAAAVPTFTSTASGPPHIMVIVEENQGRSLLGSSSAPYINSLASTYTSATDWFGVQPNSINDYLELVSGSNQGWPTTGLPPAAFGASTLGDELSTQAIGWKAYMEDIPSPCYMRTACRRATPCCRVISGCVPTCRRCSTPAGTRTAVSSSSPATRAAAAAAGTARAEGRCPPWSSPPARTAPSPPEGTITAPCGRSRRRTASHSSAPRQTRRTVT